MNGKFQIFGIHLKAAIILLHLLYEGYTEAESKETHGVWNPMPEFTITSPYTHSGVDSNTFTIGNPMPKSTLSPSGISDLASVYCNAS